jgi:hypothetical protein
VSRRFEEEFVPYAVRVAFRQHPATVAGKDQSQGVAAPLALARASRQHSQQRHAYHNRPGKPASHIATQTKDQNSLSAGRPEAGLPASRLPCGSQLHEDNDPHSQRRHPR